MQCQTIRFHEHHKHYSKRKWYDINYAGNLGFASKINQRQQKEGSMLDDGNDSRKDDKNKATSQESMKWLIGKLIDVTITLALERFLQFIGGQNLPVMEHLNAAINTLI